MKYGLILAVSAGLTASTAFAGNIKEPAPDPVVIAPADPAPLWSGPYVGAQLGYGQFEAGDDDGSGMLAGIHAGYMHQFGNSFVLGAEIDYDTANVELASNSDGEFTLESLARLKLRGGIASGRTLFYGTGGIATADVDRFGQALSDRGHVLGAGVSRMIGANGMVTGEILYHDFDDFDGASFDLDGTTATLRYSFRF